MYAILLQLNAKNDSYTEEIKNFLGIRGFAKSGEGFFVGADELNAVDCVLAVQALSEKYDWFSHYVSDARMVRISEINDLKPALNI